MEVSCWEWTMKDGERIEEDDNERFESGNWEARKEDLEVEFLWWENEEDEGNVTDGEPHSKDIVAVDEWW